jgi:transcriptional repressor NF-X1
MDTQMVDREPHRSVQLIRRLDTRIPVNILSQSSGAGSPLGKLADLRAPGRTSPALVPANSGPPRASRGWGSVLTTPRTVTPPPGAPSANSLSARTRPMGPERISRSTTPSQSSVQPVEAVTETIVVVAATAAHTGEAVPDNWEDDA